MEISKLGKRLRFLTSIRRQNKPAATSNNAATANAQRGQHSERSNRAKPARSAGFTSAISAWASALSTRNTSSELRRGGIASCCAANGRLALGRRQRQGGALGTSCRVRTECCHFDGRKFSVHVGPDPVMPLGATHDCPGLPAKPATSPDLRATAAAIFGPAPLSTSLFQSESPAPPQSPCTSSPRHRTAERLPGTHPASAPAPIASLTGGRSQSQRFRRLPSHCDGDRFVPLSSRLSVIFDLNPSARSKTCYAGCERSRHENPYPA